MGHNSNYLVSFPTCKTFSHFSLWPRCHVVHSYWVVVRFVLLSCVLLPLILHLVSPDKNVLHIVVQLYKLILNCVSGDAHQNVITEGTGRYTPQCLTGQHPLQQLASSATIPLLHQHKERWNLIFCVHSGLTWHASWRVKTSLGFSRSGVQVNRGRRGNRLSIYIFWGVFLALCSTKLLMSQCHLLKPVPCSPCSPCSRVEAHEHCIYCSCRTHVMFLFSYNDGYFCIVCSSSLILVIVPEWNFPAANITVTLCLLPPFKQLPLKKKQITSYKKLICGSISTSDCLTSDIWIMVCWIARLQNKYKKNAPKAPKRQKNVRGLIITLDYGL